MAKNQQNINMFRGFSVLCLLLMVHKACARDFMVGGSKGWSTPSDPQGYNQWAERNRFQIGDSLLFIYPPNQDSVLQVKSDAYANCNTDAPIAKFTDGHTAFKFNQSGPFYFISGNKDNCLKNEKLVVIVMADRSNNSPPPSPSYPSPAPSFEVAPSPPVTGTGETPAPSQEAPRNAASSSSSLFFTSICGLLGTAMFSSLLLDF